MENTEIVKTQQHPNKMTPIILYFIEVVFFMQLKSGPILFINMFHVYPLLIKQYVK